MNDADYDILNIGAEKIGGIARDMAREAIRIRDQHRRQIDALKADIVDLKAELAAFKAIPVVVAEPAPVMEQRGLPCRGCVNPKDTTSALCMTSPCGCACHSG